MIRAQVLFDRETYDRLKRAAAAQHKGRSALVREIVAKALGSLTPGRRRRRRYGFTFIGTFTDTARDVSVRHDDYLNESGRW